MPFTRTTDTPLKVLKYTCSHPNASIVSAHGKIMYLPEPMENLNPFSPLVSHSTNFNASSSIQIYSIFAEISSTCVIFGSYHMLSLKV